MRLERGELQKDVASVIGVSAETILHWELRQTEVTVQHYPKIVGYLGYCLIPDSANEVFLGEQVRRHRVHRGLSLRGAAIEIGVDPGALSKWECGPTRPSAKYVAKLTRLLTHRTNDFGICCNYSDSSDGQPAPPLVSSDSPSQMSDEFLGEPRPTPILNLRNTPIYLDRSV